MEERLQKIIALAGIASRRAAEKLILAGRVRLNGKVVTELGTKADASRDHIKVDGKLINPRQPKVYLMLNKPLGHVTTMADPEGRPMVSDLLRGIRTRVYPVGRLDYSTEGLLLLTNDGDFAHLVSHPSHEMTKTYLVKVKGVLEDRDVEMLERGVFLQDGKTAPAQVRRLRKEEANSWVEITIHEGRKRQVRRMIDHTGHSVIKLKRIRIGNLDLGDLPAGTYRHLTAEEVRALRDMAQGSGQPAAIVTDAPARMRGPDWKRREVEVIPGPVKRERKPAKERPAATVRGPRKERTGGKGFPQRAERSWSGRAQRPAQSRQRSEPQPGEKRPWQGEQHGEKPVFPRRGPSSRTTGPGTGASFRPRQSGGKPFSEGTRRPAQRERRSEGRGAGQGERVAGRTVERPHHRFVKQGQRPAGRLSDERRSSHDRPRAEFRGRTETRGRRSREGRSNSFGARNARPEGTRTWQDRGRSGGPVSWGAGARSRERSSFSAGGSRSGGQRSSGSQTGRGRAVKPGPPKGRGPKRR
jgi:23S rRNA pseudouridine2605 synthase